MGGLAGAGIRSIVSIQNIFSANEDGSWTCSLPSGYQAAWAAYATQIAPYVNAGNIASFYIADEPYWAFTHSGCSDQGVYNWLSTASSLVKSKFQVQAVPSGIVTFENPTTAKCLDVTGGNGANLTKVQLYDCNGSAEQQWVYQ